MKKLRLKTKPPTGLKNYNYSKTFRVFLQLYNIKDIIATLEDMQKIRKAVANGTFIKRSINLFKSIVGIDASELYIDCMCREMPTGFYTRWDSKKKKYNNSMQGKNEFERLKLWSKHFFK